MNTEKVEVLINLLERLIGKYKMKKSRGSKQIAWCKEDMDKISKVYEELMGMSIEVHNVH